MFLLVSLPMYNVSVALWKPLCVSPRTSDLLLRAEKWKISLQPFHNHSHVSEDTLLDPHSAHDAVGTYWLRVLGLKYKYVGNGSCILNLSTDNWIKSDRKTPEGKRQDSKVNITSSHFNVNETFHTFLCIVMILPLERKPWLILVFGDLYTFPSLGKKKLIGVDKL